MPRIVTPEMEQRIVRHYQLWHDDKIYELNNVGLARALGVSTCTVTEVARRHGLTTAQGRKAAA